MPIKTHILAVALLTLSCTTAYAQQQRTKSKPKIENPYSSSYTIRDTKSFGTFYVQYSPLTWHDTSLGYADDKSYNALSMGFSYFTPLAGPFGIDAGLKAQLFYRSKREGELKHKNNMFSATVPVNAMVDIQLGRNFAIVPFAGLYARYNFSAKDIMDYSADTRRSVNLFNDKQTDFYQLTRLKRFQAGWQLGANVRISDVVTFGAAYWMDIAHISTDASLRGTDFTLGINF